MESHEKTAETTGETRGLEPVTLEMQSPNGNGSIPPRVRQLKDLDDLFPYIGGFGWYQRILFLLMIPYAFFFAFVYFAQIFMTVVPAEHWCYVPELGNLTVEERRHLSIPQNELTKYERCLVYDVDWNSVLESGTLMPESEWPTKKCEGKWEFNFTDVPYETIATELGWVCDKDNYPATAQAIFFCGSIIGGLIFGWIADKFGRVPAIVGTNMAGFLAGVGTAFTNSFWSFCLCRFLVGLAYDNCFVIMYIVVVEYVGPKWRTFVANMSIAVYFTFAACLLPWIALGVSNWKIYTLATSVPLVLAVLTPYFVPESARWLIAQGRLDEAFKILKKFERINGKKIPEEISKEFKETAIEIAKAEAEIKNYSVVDLFKTPRLRRHSILLVIIWMSIAMVFDGHVRNVGSLGLDIFMTFTVATATEFPADILLIMVLDVMGRRWLAFGSMVMSGLFSFLATTVPLGIPSASLAIVGRFAVNISYNIGMQYAAELLPTVVRAQGLALIHISGYVATILVPYIVYLATISPEIPLLILGAIGIFGGCLCLFLPESMGKNMPQTIQDGEEYGSEQKFWDMPCCKRKICDSPEEIKI
ncbi:carcinine transporter-like [Maniola jurtina]|uniref:carcinine transporter-like n=1 Tax=Maniola jurtina TaxID=191418 RepID=UPI001E68E5EB|nr:carcinine transporter-like [Maniola jurtina]